MFMKSCFLPLAILAVADHLVMAHEGTAAEKQPGKFRITTKRANDRVEVGGDEKKAAFSIRSPFGISHAVIERLDAKWPETVILQLHLKGLENFQVSNGNTSIHAAASVPQ